MTTTANILIGLVAALHLYFLVLEMFFWDRPLGLRTFGHSPAAAAVSKKLAMNQGLYNGFLAAGLVWGLSLGTGTDTCGNAIKLFFLGCMVIAGVFGGITVARKILFIQALPAALAIAVLFLA